mmetsp:Transcript_25221/g.70312  ORF Transcript_25221/g.70312 Transcript_25221/m.70312 type:complete len:382 (-) Transcript_25221:287-1432(-)
MRRLALLKRDHSLNLQGQRDCEMSLTVRTMSGEIVWGPQSMRRTAPVGALFRRVATTLQRPVPGIKLFIGSQEVSAANTLEGAGLVDGATMSVVVLDLKSQASQGIQKIVSLSKEQGAAFACDDEQENVPRDSIPEHVTAIAQACACTTFSEVIGDWLEVFLLHGKVMSWCVPGMSEICFTRHACLESRPGLLYLNSCSDGDGLTFYMVDLDGDLSDWIDQPTLDEGRGAVWYGVMANDNGHMLDGANPPLSFWRSALSGGGLKFQENLVNVIRCVAFGISDFFSRWTLNGPPTAAIDNLPLAPLPRASPRPDSSGVSIASDTGCTTESGDDSPDVVGRQALDLSRARDEVDGVSMFCTVVYEYVAEAGGYLSVHASTSNC